MIYESDEEVYYGIPGREPKTTDKKVQIDSVLSDDNIQQIHNLQTKIYHLNNTVKVLTNELKKEVEKLSNEVERLTALINPRQT